MGIEFIPTPQQLMDLGDSGMEFNVVISHAHKCYYVYITDDVAEFTAEMMGIAKLSAFHRPNPQDVVDAMTLWESPVERNRFGIWLNDYNKRAYTEDFKQIPKIYG